MNRKINGYNADYLKRKAKSLKKAQGVSHTEALNQIAKDHGFDSWGHLINNLKIVSKPKKILRRPNIPEPSVLNYHDIRTGTILGQHPNKKMPIRHHARIGSLLKELLGEVEYHKRAKNPIQDIRIIMDTWLGNEYTEAELYGAEFNEIYYGNNAFAIKQDIPTLKRQTELKRSLKKAKSIIDRNYHDCKPLDKLHQRFDLALKALEKWPISIKVPGSRRFKDYLSSGTFVRINRNKQIGLVFTHDITHQVIEGYADGGRFLVGRHEVSVLKKQLKVSDFKPMRSYLPYGKWSCADGREVLFNRDYCPIWEKLIDGTVTAMQPDSHVKYEESEYYYDDRTAPYRRNEETYGYCIRILQEWGVAEKRNVILDLLPLALSTRDTRLLSPKGES